MTLSLLPLDAPEAEHNQQQNAYNGAPSQIQDRRDLSGSTLGEDMAVGLLDTPAISYLADPQCSCCTETYRLNLARESGMPHVATQAQKNAVKNATLSTITRFRQG